MLVACQVESTGLPRWLPLVTVGVPCVLLVWLLPDILGISLAFLTFGAYTGLIVRKHRRMEHEVNRGQELAMLRRHPAAIRHVWEQLPRTRRNPGMHSRLVATLGHSLDRLGAYEAAVEVYDYLLAHLSPDAPLAILFGVQRAGILAMDDRLVDADRALRQLANSPFVGPGSPVNGAHVLSSLMLQSRTRHWQDIVDRSDELLASLRPIGTEAGFGYAIVAMAFHQLAAAGSTEDAVRNHLAEHAQTWWHRATMLLSVDAILTRLPDIADTAGALAAAPALDALLRPHGEPA